MALLSISKKKDVYACLTNFSYLYRIVFQCNINYFHRPLPQKLNFFEKFLYYVRNV